MEVTVHDSPLQLRPFSFCSPVQHHTEAPVKTPCHLGQILKADISEAYFYLPNDLRRVELTAYANCNPPSKSELITNYPLNMAYNS